MKPWLTEILRCTSCGSRLTTSTSRNQGFDDSANTAFKGDSCERVFPVLCSVPRFVPAANYADNFGLQWNRFRKTQLDSNAGLPVSRERFFRTTGGMADELAGKRVLDAGCGAGRFTEIALGCGAEVVAIDYSSSIDACIENLKRHPQFTVTQADIYNLPFVLASFDYVYCLGVLQHTPDVENAFAALPVQLKPGGKLAVDVYPKLKRNLLWSKYWLRPFTKRMDTGKLLQLVRRMAPALLFFSRLVGYIPFIGRRLRYAIPVANYEGIYPLNQRQPDEWAVLDTFDMLSPAYDQPQSAETLTKWAGKLRLKHCEVFRSGFLIFRAVR